MRNQILVAVLTATLALTFSPAASLASTYTPLANGGYATGVTSEMTSVDYWTGLIGSSADDVLATASDIAAVNQAAIDGVGTNSIDITHDYKIKSVTPSTIPTRAFYANGVLVDNEAYFGALSEAINATQWSNIGDESKWGICIKKANIKDWPTNDFLGYSATDSDDEMQGGAAVVNEPVQIRQKCEVDGHLFYYITTTNMSGWADSDCIAVCKDKQEWLDAWQVDATAKDFLVVEQTGIFTQASVNLPDISKVELQLGCILKLVADKDIPATVDGRSTWNNYVVYLPTRDENGNYVAQMALIQERYQLSEGYPEFTQRNVAQIALNCAGDRYGWGECLDAFDCSAYVRYIYRCFGYELPRNTNWQCNVPGIKLSLANMNDDEKTAVISTLPIGSALYFYGHTMLYLGTVNGVPYVISDVGHLVDTGSTESQSVCNVAITPLTVCRSSATTSGDTTSSRWLTWIDAAVITAPQSAEQAGITVTCDSRFTYNGNVQQPAASDFHVLTRAGVELPASYYDLTIQDESVDVGAYDCTVAIDNAGVTGAVKGTYEIAKAEQAIDGGKKTASVKAGKSCSFSIGCSATAGKLNYKKTRGSKLITVTSKGKVKLKATTAKGTYTAKVKASAAATSNYKAAIKMLVIKIKVK